MQLEHYFKKQPNNAFFKKLGQLLITNKFVKIIEIVSPFLVVFLFIKLFITNETSDLLYNQMVVWFANIFMLAIVFTGIKLRGEGLSHFGFSFKRFNWKSGFKTFYQSLVVFMLAMAGFVIGSIIMANITGIPETSDMSGYDYLKDNYWMLLLTLGGTYIVASFGEEVIYRAFLINRISELGLSSKTGKILTIIISAVIFGFAHYTWGPMGIVQTAFMGLALGICYLYFKKRIWMLILAHAYMDTILMLQMYFS